MKDTAPEPMRPHSDEEYHHATMLMERSGGKFSASLARTYFFADKHNQARLRAAFPDLFTKYFNIYINLPKE